MRNNYNFSLKEFLGPLDLLLSLVREQKKDILEIDMLVLANQYLEYITKNKDNIDFNVSSEYLVMASYLLHLKTKTILPFDNPIDDEESYETNRQQLIAKLIEYRKYKESIPFFIEQLKTRTYFYSKPASRIKGSKEINNTLVFPSTWNNSILLKAINNMFSTSLLNHDQELAVLKSKINAQQIETKIMEYLKKQKQVEFKQIWESSKTLEYMLSSFVCVLDLTKSGLVTISQQEDFGEIYLQKRIN